jgi:hypothetical protein
VKGSDEAEERVVHDLARLGRLLRLGELSVVVGRGPKDDLVELVRQQLLLRLREPRELALVALRARVREGPNERRADGW